MNDQQGITFTLKADKQPFWEIVRQLSAQHPLAWKDNRLSHSSTYSLYASQSSLPHLTVASPLAIAPRVSATADGRWDLTMLVQCDPRVKVLSFDGIFDVTEALDDTGKKFPDDNLRALAVRDSRSETPMLVWTTRALLPVPPRPRQADRVAQRRDSFLCRCARRPRPP
jgi:hypothetical protein